MLNSHKVEYLVVGAHALAWHGLPRHTKDIDLFVATSLPNSEAIMQVISDFGFSSVGLNSSDFLAPEQVIQLGIEPNRIDILTGISGVSWQEAWDTRHPGTLGEVPVNYLGPQAFLKNKDASGRPQDFADASRLRSILKEK